MGYTAHCLRQSLRPRPASNKVEPVNGGRAANHLFNHTVDGTSIEAEGLGGLEVDHKKLVDCITGRSTSFSPLRRRPV
jgi:hypothetical protein